MSNRQRLPGARRTVHCAVCGKGTGKTSRQVTLRDGRVVCGRCVDAGALLRRLDCGHYATAGNNVAAAGGQYLCAACAQATLQG